MKEKERRIKQNTEEGDGSRRKKEGGSSKIQKKVMEGGERKERQARYRRATERKRGEVKDRRKV